MFPDILSNKQRELLPVLARFKREFVLAGGTAVALYIGHRRSIDFDLFSTEKLNKTRLAELINSINYPKQLLFEDYDGVHYLVNGVKITFMHYPFDIKAETEVDGSVYLPDLKTLAAMKFYAMGRRAKWKDYVDIYFLLKNHFTIEEVSEKANEMFESAYSEKLFRQQIAYFEDIDYSEPIEWIKEPVGEGAIKRELVNFSIGF